MSKREARTLIGSVDQYVLMAILRQDANAYGVSIRDEIERRTGLQISTGSIYLALDRLERDALVEARTGEPTPERGGRRKTYFRITPRGEDALNAVAQHMKALSHGTTMKGAFA